MTSSIGSRIDTDAVLGTVAANPRPTEAGLHPALWQALREAGLPRACLPERLGGGEVSPPDLVDAITALARGDASTGWAAAVHAPAGVFLTLLPELVAVQILAEAGDGLLVGGSSHPAGTARLDGDQLRLAGRWPLVTGAHQISHAFLAATVHTGGAPTVRWLCVPRRQFRVVEDWDAHGLRGTDSASVEVHGVLVPADHTVDLTGGVDRGGGGLARFPRYGLLAACLAAVAIGTGTHAHDLFLDTAGRHQPRHATGRLGEQPAAQVTAAEASGRLAAARLYLAHAVRQAWSAALAGDVPDDARLDLRLAAAEASRAATEVGRALFATAGSAAVYRRTGLGECLRDLDVIAAHALLAGTGRRRAGQYLLTGTCPKDL